MDDRRAIVSYPVQNLVVVGVTLAVPSLSRQTPAARGDQPAGLARSSTRAADGMRLSGGGWYTH